MFVKKEKRVRISKAMFLYKFTHLFHVILVLSSLARQAFLNKLYCIFSLYFYKFTIESLRNNFIKGYSKTVLIVAKKEFNLLA